MSGSRQKVRAILLSFVMVVSIMGAGVAFSGTAAAAVNSVSGSSGDSADIGQGSVDVDLTYASQIDGTSSTETYALDVSNIKSAVDSVSVDTDGSDVTVGGPDGGDVSASLTDNIASDNVGVTITDTSQDGTTHDFTTTVTLTLDTSSSTRTSGISVPLISNGGTGTTSLNLQEPVNPTVTATPTRTVDNEITEVSFDIENHPSNVQANFNIDDPIDGVTSGTTSDGSFTFTADPAGNGDISVGESYTISVDYTGEAEFSGTDSTTVQVAPPLDAAVTYDPSPPAFDGTVQISGQLNNSVDSNDNPTFDDSKSFNQLDLIRGDQDADPATANTEATNIRVLSDGTITSNELDIDDAGNYTLVYEDGSANRFILEGTTIESTGISGADVTAEDGTGNTVSQISSIQDSDTITLTQPNADSASNVTRFVLSGANLEKLDLSNDANADIERITMSDGSSVDNFGTNAGADLATPAPDIDDDGTDEFDNGASTFTQDGTAVLVANTDEATIESVVILADDGTGDNDVDLVVNPAESGTLNIESQVEDDTEDTPNVPDVTSSTSIDVPEPQDLNVLLSPDSNDLSSGTTTVDVTVLDADGAGLIDDGNNPSNEDINSLDITLSGNGTQFEVSAADTADDDGAGSITSGSTGNNKDQITYSVASDDGSLSGDTTQFSFDGVNGEENGTIDVDVEATLANGNTISGSAAFTIADSDAVSGLPSGQLSANEFRDLNISVSDGDEFPLNNREVTFTPDTADAFAVDTNGDGSNDVTGIDTLRLSGIDNQVQFDTDDSGFAEAADSQDSLLVNNGQYQLDNLNITDAGATVDITVTDSPGDTKASFPSQFSSTGADVYEIQSDVDPLVAGLNEQVNFTVTRSGNEVNGSELNEFVGGGTFTVDQAGDADITTDTAETVNTDNDGTVDTIRVDVTPTSETNVANVTVASSDSSLSGDSTIDVVSPEVQTDLANNRLTERLNQTVEITAIDPRTGDRLDIADEGADIRITALNGTVEIRDLDNKHTGKNDDVVDTTNDPDGQAFELNDNGDNTRDSLIASDVANSNLSIAALPYDPDNEQFTLEVEIDQNAGNYFGSTNLTVEPPQVRTNFDSIELGDSRTLRINVQDANGENLGDRQVRVDGSVSPITGTTDSSGFLPVNVEPQAAGQIDISTASDGDIETSRNSPAILSADGSIEKGINVTTEQSDFDLTVEPQTVTANQTSSVTVTAVENATGDTVQGANVVLSGAGVDESARTDSNGEATIDVNASQAGTIDVSVNDGGFNEATSTITVEEEPEPGAVQIDNVNLDPSSVTANTTNDHDLTFDALNVSADNSTDSFTVQIPSAAELDSANDLTITTENVSAQNLNVDGNDITFDVNPDTEATDLDLSVEANVTVSAPNVSQVTTADLTIDATDSDGTSDSESATLTITPENVDTGSVTFEDQQVTNGTEEVTVNSANYTLANGTAGDYVVVAHVVYDNGSISSPVGYSPDDDLSNGEANITINLNDSDAAFEDDDALDTLSENVTLRAMLHETSSDTAFGDSLGLATDDATITVQEADPGEVPADFPGSAEQFTAISGDDGDISTFDLVDAVEGASDDGVYNGVEITTFDFVDIIEYNSDA